MSDELARLRAECDRLTRENQRLRNALKRIGGDVDSIAQAEEHVSAGNMTAGEKVKVFYDVFHGRRDVYALRWESRGGRPGYSPAHSHDGDPSLCRRPRDRCRAMGTKRFFPLTQDVMREHLTGRSVVGVYPLLVGDTCRFLAADFDGDGWREESARFAAVCRDHGLPVYVERSRSGDGAHAWLFFDQVVLASKARELGLRLLAVVSMQQYPVEFAAFDRLFPNQDTLPKGGFGNLIALPLQREARPNGNTEFIDPASGRACDQWALLSSVLRITESQLDDTLDDLDTPLHHLVSSSTFDRGMSGESAAETVPPWDIGSTRSDGIPDAVLKECPSEVGMVRSNLLYIEKQGVPPVVLNHLRSLAAFSNPDFYRAQKMRMSVWGKPRVISCAEDFVSHLGLPRGCESDARSFLEASSVSVRVEDNRNFGSPLAAMCRASLTEMQQDAKRDLLEHETGVLCAPTGFGKTVVAAAMVAERATNVLILVHRRRLAQQWEERIREFLDTPADSVAVLGKGASGATGVIDIGLFQGLFRDGTVNAVVSEYGHVIVDECHHVSAFSFEQVLREVRARYVLGLTATPIRKDGRHPIIRMQCGPIRVRINEKTATAARGFAHTVIPRKTELTIPDSTQKPIYEVYDALVDDETRNQMIVRDIDKCCHEGRLPLVLSERIRHLHMLEERLRDRVDRCLLLIGGMGKKRTQRVFEGLAEADRGSTVALLATGRLVGEGFDHPRLDTLFLTFPVSWKGIVQQYTGRLHREHADKRDVRVYDYVDSEVPILLASYRRRLKSYRSMGYGIDEGSGDLLHT